MSFVHYTVVPILLTPKNGKGKCYLIIRASLTVGVFRFTFWRPSLLLPGRFSLTKDIMYFQTCSMSLAAKLNCYSTSNILSSIISDRLRIKIWFSTSQISIAFLRIPRFMCAGYRNLSNLNVTNLPGLWMARPKVRRASIKLGMRRLTTMLSQHRPSGKTMTNHCNCNMSLRKLK